MPHAALSRTCFRSKQLDQEMEIMSVPASNSLFSQDPSPAPALSEAPSEAEFQDSDSDVPSGQSRESTSVVGSVETTLKAVLACLQLDAPTPVMGSENAFLCHSQHTSIVIPQCCDFTCMMVSALEGATKAVRPD